jgi:hypothetical protein
MIQDMLGKSCFSIITCSVSCPQYGKCMSITKYRETRRLAATPEIVLECGIAKLTMKMSMIVTAKQLFLCEVISLSRPAVWDIILQ